MKEITEAAAPKIKLCGLTRPCDIEAANHLKPDYIGFVFAPKSRRYISPERAKLLKETLLRETLGPFLSVVGVFVNGEPETVAELLNQNVIHMAQLHGKEDESYIRQLRMMTDKPIIQAFRIDTAEDVWKAQESSADYILLDSGNGGTGTVFDWNLLRQIDRPYFLAGGLNPQNVADAVNRLHPYAVDVSSGIETEGLKDRRKMTEFVRIAREAAGKEGNI